MKKKGYFSFHLTCVNKSEIGLDYVKLRVFKYTHLHGAHTHPRLLRYVNTHTLWNALISHLIISCGTFALFIQFPITAIREIKILKKLHHENVVKLKEIVTSAGTFVFIVHVLSHITILCINVYIGYVLLIGPERDELRNLGRERDEQENQGPERDKQENQGTQICCMKSQSVVRVTSLCM